MDQDKEKEMNRDHEKEVRKQGKLLWILLLAIVLAVFGGIVLFTGFLGNQFGETAENAALAVIALILAALLYITHKQK